MANQYLSERQQNENYNCSGIVEYVLNETLKIDFGDPPYSTPLRVAEIMSKIANIKVIAHDEKLLGERPSTIEANRMRPNLQRGG